MSDHEETTRDRIFNTSVELFSRYGYENVPMTQIGEAIGIKAASIYNHFKSKQ